MDEETPRYWIFQESSETFPFDSGESQGYPKLWAIKRNFDINPPDIVYFWRKNHESLLYGWGVIASEPKLLHEEDKATYQAVGFSSEYPAGVTVRYAKFFSPVSRAEISDDPTLRSLVEQASSSGRVLALSTEQATALNRLIRARGVAAPPNPLIEPSGEQGEGDESGGDKEGDTSLDQLLESYSQRISALSRHILELAQQFANQRKHNRDQLTTSCILFAAVELGAQPTNQDIETASQFLFQWMNSEFRSNQYRRAFAEFLGTADLERRPELAIPTSHTRKVMETAVRIADAVRKEMVTSERAVIHARDLVGALLFTMARNSRLGAARRLAGVDVSLEALRTDYFNQFLNHEKNPDDDIEKWRRVIIQLKLPGEERKSVPNIDADTPSEKDHLNIKPEVEGFAKIIAAKDVKTPLSIGIFGDWGSGKSTFMEQLQAAVEEIAGGVRDKKQDEKTSFHGNIVQIRFNAWHYAEANLWASLVSHVFENLSFSETEEKAKAQERKELFLGKLVTGLAAQKAAEADVKDKEAKYENAKTVLDGAKQEQIEARLERRDVVVNGIWPIVREFLSDDVDAQQQVDAAGELLGKSGLTEEGLKREIEASRTTLRRAKWYLSEIRKDPRRWLYVALILISMIVIPIALTFVLTILGMGQVWARVAEFPAPLVPLIMGALAWLRSKRDSVQAVLDTLEKANNRLDEVYKRARGKYDERLSLLNNELEKKQGEVNIAKELVENTKTEVDETLTTLREMEPARLLQTFVQERASSEDYRKLLGVIALIRRDFKKLSDLLSDQGKDELRQAVTDILRKDEEASKQKLIDEATVTAAAVNGDGKVAAAAVENDGNTLPAGAEGDGKAVPKTLEQRVEERLKEYRIDRIVLYIDDLDRCLPKQVVDVLQAIHLLLAFKLFVVVVGVDARWIRHALRKRFPEMLSEDWDEGVAPQSGEERLAKMATPRDYVEKIFQVPFWLKPMDDGASRTLLEGLIPDEQLLPAAKTDDIGDATHKARTAGAKGQQTLAGNGSGDSKRDSVGKTDASTTSGAEDRGKSATNASSEAKSSSAGAGKSDEAPKKPPLVLNPEGLLLDVKERNAMIALSRVIGRTPRTLKRFVNVYRIIKAGLDDDRLEAFMGTGPSDAQYTAVLVLLGVAHGAPDVAPAFFRELKQEHEKTVENNEKDMGLKAFLNQVLTLPPTADESLSRAWSGLIGELLRASKDADDIPLSVLRDWLPVIVRYTFQLGRLSEEVAQQNPHVAQKTRLNPISTS